MITTSTIWTRSSGRRKLAPKSQLPAAQSSHVRDVIWIQMWVCTKQDRDFSRQLPRVLWLLPPENLLLWQGTAAFSCCHHALLREEFHPEQGHNLHLGKVFQDGCVFFVWLFVVVVLIEKSYVLTKLKCLTRVCFLRHSQLTYCGRFVFDGVPGLISVTVQHRVHNRIHFVIADTATAFLVEREGSGCQSATFLECLSHASFFSFFLFL